MAASASAPGVAPARAARARLFPEETWPWPRWVRFAASRALGPARRICEGRESGKDSVCFRTRRFRR
ncbi:hypothetical protein MUG91_G183n61 [Manis pentadactyla]|nr:hypothetical protein MUG91_G183n61 [Manis pentadactyla]